MPGVLSSFLLALLGMCMCNLRRPHDRQVHRCNVDAHEDSAGVVPFPAANADIWSCGVCLFAMLATQLPFGGGEDVRIALLNVVPPASSCSPSPSLAPLHGSMATRRP
mgnify:CR=1 FL=1